MFTNTEMAALAFSVDPGCLRKGWGIMGFLKNNPKQSSRAYPILSDVSGFPGSKIGDTFDSCNIGHGPLKRCGSSGVFAATATLERLSPQKYRPAANDVHRGSDGDTRSVAGRLSRKPHRRRQLTQRDHQT
jgi:hypothetical protein